MAALAEGPRSGGSQGERIDWLEGARCDPEKEGSSMSRSTRAWIACALILLGVGVAILSPIGPNLRFDYHTRSCDCVVVRDAETYCRLNLEDSRRIRHLIRCHRANQNQPLRGEMPQPGDVLKKVLLIFVTITTNCKGQTHLHCRDRRLSFRVWASLTRGAKWLVLTPHQMLAACPVE